MCKHDPTLRRQRLIGPIVGALLAGLPAYTAAAEDLFTFSGETGLADQMTALTEALAHDVVPTDPCRFDILSDLRGNQLFDDQTSRSMHREMAARILGAEQVDGCVVQSHDVGQDEIAGFLDERRQAGELGHTLALSYYKLNEGVTMFAVLRDVDGTILGSTGRFDLAVAIATEGDTPSSVATAETQEHESENGTSLPTETSPATETAPQPEQDVAARTQPALDKGAGADNGVEVLTEATTRRQLAADTRTTLPQEQAFNLRRVQAGVSPSIKTIRIVDTRGLNADLVTDLADRFLDTLATSPESRVDATELDARATRIAIHDHAGSDAEAIDIRAAETPAAYREILNNDSDIVVTREPISLTEAASFAGAYGVNMRSRYAEHVVAIAQTEASSAVCGIRFPEDGMSMSTEDHPDSERVYFYVNPSIPNALRDQFVDFVLSEDGQRAVAAYAVDLRLRLGDARYAAWRYQVTGEQEPEIDDLRERFRGLIRTSQRVSSTFRFDFASADLALDSRSEQDLENLIELIKTQDIDGRRILLFGFADSLGQAPFNATLSRGRADAVATRLRLAGVPVPPGNVHGIGEDSPVACDIQSDGERDELGAHKNRRVEVWIES